MPVSSQRIAADVGGTFTDLAVFDESGARLRLGKTLTTPTEPVQGIAQGTERAQGRFDQAAYFLHGSTMAINLLLERKGARTALVTTSGFRDVYEIGRINRPDAYNLFFRKHRPLIERALRFEVDERCGAQGEVVTPLEVATLEPIALQMEREGIEAVAIFFLHSYRNPAHELAAKRFFSARLPGVFITASHELSQEYREFERTSTVAANAYVGAGVSRYIEGIDRHLTEAGFPGRFLIVQSTGGLFASNRARSECVRMLESGPAAGVIGTRALCEAIGLDRAIAFDMGGTTAKAGIVIDGRVQTANTVMVGGYAEGLPVQVPMIDIQEVGTGGGSIARLNAGGGIRVGPHSAGAQPGPVCYGAGGLEPTVTDANLILGRLDASRFLGGEMPLDAAAARAAMAEKIATPLGLSIEQAAEGIVRIATAAMAHVVKRVTTERGLDARDFTMVAYGGAGPLHAVLVARELAVARVIIPAAPGHFSAIGMLMSDLRRDAVRTVFVRLGATAATSPFDLFDQVFAEMEAEGRAELALADVDIEYGADMRYVGQEHAVEVTLPVALFRERDLAAIKARFDQAHLQRYGYASQAERAEVVSLRCAISARMSKPLFEHIELGAERPAAQAFRGERPVWFSPDGYVPTPAYQREALLAGNRIDGPALIEEHASTTVLPPGSRLTVDRLGNLLIDVVAA